MNWELEEENKIRRYLLRDLPPESAQQVEEDLLGNDEYAEQLVMIEDELIDDYARGLLPELERDLFEQNFLITQVRRKKLMIAQAAVKYAEALGTANVDQPALSNVLAELPNTPSVTQPDKTLQNARPGREWWQTLFAPAWKIAVYVVLALGIGLGIWQMNSSESDVAVATKVMSQAYHTQRPLETRITGFDYAPFPKTLGSDQGRADYVALDRAERILLDAVAEHPTVEGQHALGRLYLARKKFDQAEKLFKAALQSDPNDARLHSDLGAVLFERWDREHSAEQTAESEELKRQSLEHLEKALALDGSLREARFNLAILYQASNQTQLARAEWEKYLAIEPDSRGKKEAERNLELLK